MSKPARTGATAPFAHLLSLVTGAKAGKRAEDEHDENEASEEEDETDAEESDEDTSAEEADRDEEASEDEDDAEAEEDEEKKEAKAKADRAAGFAAAQARGRKIFGAASAALRPDMAAHLAFNETMPTAKAINMLDMAAAGGTATSAESGSRLHRRMSRVVVPAPGTGGSGGKRGAASEVDDFAAQAKAAAEKAGIR